jgi:transcriptional regulator with XRE-family HTH domain
MALKDRIQEAMDGSTPKLSRAQIARACSMTNAAVTHWLNGETKSLKADKALALEAATGYRATWILTGKGSKRVSEPFWPFTVGIDRYKALTERQKGFVDARLLQAVEECETGRPPASVERLGESLDGERTTDKKQALS